MQRFIYHTLTRLFFFCLLIVFPASVHGDNRASSPVQVEAAGSFSAQLNQLHELWSYYKYSHIEDGRVIIPDKNNITTSEGQSYAMLRAVWANDHETFHTVWQWTKTHLRRDEDLLFARQYKHDANAATDADCDIALSLILAAERFSMPDYREEALAIIHNIWEKEVAPINGNFYLTAGSQAPEERYPTIRVAYFAPYIYELFARVDSEHPWHKVIESGYDMLEWIYIENKYPLPPEILFVDSSTGNYLLKNPLSNRHPPARFSYDAYPLFWRVAADELWFNRGKDELRTAMLFFFKNEWRQNHAFFDTYTITGRPLSSHEGLPLYATIYSLSAIDDPQLASAIYNQKIANLWDNAVTGKNTSYFLHNWLWFSHALNSQVARNLTDVFDFLKPFDFKGFKSHFPMGLLVLSLCLYVAIRLVRFKYDHLLRTAFIVCGFTICIRYFWWRLNYSLNFLELFGPVISITLLAAELYCISTVVLLLIQVGIGPGKERKITRRDGFAPLVDIYIPIYSESLDILEKTLIAALAIRYSNKQVFVLDDSHRNEIKMLAEQLGATYLKGPKKHAKAGNLNHALPRTDGDIIVVFDTDHIPVSTFLDETVPLFADPKLGMIQTPHHFYNQDVFQRAFLCNHKVPNEQDMFNHGMQGARDSWLGSFFVGSGALFRRTALESIGGFKLMSVTEDIHTSQHLHAMGFTSAFVNKDLAVGLTAENFSAYIIQRTRWMQGCLQIFFKNNPLFQKGLGIRLRFGYLASLYYFFFPIARVVFCLTPLYYLLFHLHPLLADVSILLAYMVPYLIILPLISSALINQWPRAFWGVTYENAVCFPLLLSMFTLLMPGNLEFKVTPKGIVSDKRRFDFSSSILTLSMVAITVAAILKGVWEYSYFKIEKDAYFFNIAWAFYNLLFLSASVLVAWERPQKRKDERLKISIPFKLIPNGTTSGERKDLPISGTINDISLSGASIFLDAPLHLPKEATLVLFEDQPLSLPVRCLYQDKKIMGKIRCGFRFENPDPLVLKKLFLRTFASPNTWERAHEGHTRSNIMMMYYFLKGVIFCFLPAREMKRSSARVQTLKKVRVLHNGRQVSAILRNRSKRGLKLLLFTKDIEENKADAQWVLSDGVGKVKVLENRYLKKIIPYVYQAGFKVTAKIINER